jgi:multiple sugar transport system ATP-binding protein
MARVVIRDVAKFYGSVEALKGVSVDVVDGEFLVLVGPSGCGKSTLLRMIAGLEEISAGQIIIGDKVVNDLSPKERDIAMVFQNYALYPHMTVAENMGFSLRLGGAPKVEIKEKVDRAAAILGLHDLLERQPRQLSGGQRQRVAMGRAIVRDPQVFLFDEPLSNLDAKLRVQMRAEIKELHQRLGTTTIYVTHDQIEAMTMADKIVLLRDGVVEQMGTPLELYDSPVNMFVAGFIGSPSMNFINGEIRAEGFCTGDGVVLPLGGDASAGTGRGVYGVRPEHLHLDQGGVEATLIVVEPTGSETMVVARLGQQQIVGVFRERITSRPGETIRIVPEIAATHLFREDGVRILSDAPRRRERTANT